MTERLQVYLDTSSLDKFLTNTGNNLTKILSADQSLFLSHRSNISTTSQELKKVHPINVLKERSHLEYIEQINGNIFRRKLTNEQKEFVFLMTLFAATHPNFNRRFFEDSVFVSEDPLILENMIRIGESRLSLRDFFPGVRLVNFSNALRVMDIYSKSKRCYQGAPKNGVTEWYSLYLLSKASHFPALYKNSIIFDNTTPGSKPIEALIFRFHKILLCLDYLGKQHYFGESRKNQVVRSDLNEGLEQLHNNSIPDISKLRGFVDVDDNLITFYHMEYLISLITGVFDNLAEETRGKYNIEVNGPMEISLSKSVRGDFLNNVYMNNSKCMILSR
jgi:hypothetical protein